jgi:NarL family two-component system response regulator LiaR
METTTDAMPEQKAVIHVLSVDDHDLLRDGIRISLLTSSDIELVGEARSGEDALRLCAELKPDVVLMDVQLPRMNGIEATRAIRDDHPQTQVLVLTSFVEDSLVQEAIQAGAVGYLSKASSRVELADAIRAAHAGQTTLSNEAMQALFRATKSPKTIGGDLTTRQRDVLREMVAGRNNNEIAEKLFLSPSTVGYHVSEILSKLNAANRAEAAALAVRHDLV